MLTGLGDGLREEHGGDGGVEGPPGVMVAGTSGHTAKHLPGGSTTSVTETQGQITHFP